MSEGSIPWPRKLSVPAIPATTDSKQEMQWCPWDLEMLAGGEILALGRVSGQPIEEARTFPGCCYLSLCLSSLGTTGCV